MRYTHPLQAVLAGSVLILSQNPTVRAICENNTEDRACEGLAGPWWDQAVGQALLSLREQL